MKEVLPTQNSFYHDIKSILQTARDNAYKSVNFIMVEAYCIYRSIRTGMPEFNRTLLQ